MRQSQLTHYIFSDILKFDYKKELAVWWGERNREQLRAECEY